MDVLRSLERELKRLAALGRLTCGRGTVGKSMLASKIRNVRNGLGVLAGLVTEEQWGLIMMARDELTDAADTAEELENAMASRPDATGKE
jgi:hypothetical protein